MEPTTPSHSLYGAVSGIPNSGRSRIASPHYDRCFVHLPCPTRRFVAQEVGDNCGGSPQSCEKSLGVAFRPQPERAGGCAGTCTCPSAYPCRKTGSHFSGTCRSEERRVGK